MSLRSLPEQNLLLDKSKEPVKHPQSRKSFLVKRNKLLKSQTRQFPPKLKHYLFKSGTQIFHIFSMFSLIENKLLILLPPILNWAYNRSSQKKKYYSS